MWYSIRKKGDANGQREGLGHIDIGRIEIIGKENDDLGVQAREAGHRQRRLRHPLQHGQGLRVYKVQLQQWSVLHFKMKSLARSMEKDVNIYGLIKNQVEIYL